MKNSEPAIKPQYASTFHQDGTVSHWGVYSQCWRRMPASQIGTMGQLSLAIDAARTVLEKVKGGQ